MASINSRYRCILLAAVAALSFSPRSCVAVSSDDDEHIYWEFTGIENFPYFPEEFEASEKHLHPMDAVFEKMGKNGIHEGHFILNDFVVGGVNLANFGVEHPPFELYDNFDIGSYVINAPGILGWKQLLKIRNSLERPSLSWYVDKVARKRWFKEQDIYPQPQTFFAKYCEI